jgi:alkylation response protein AidB-like acyl-CoA dehydrogenase
LLKRLLQAQRFARVCLEEAIKYAHKRRTFGQRLIDHPVIRNKALLLLLPASLERERERE